MPVPPALPPHPLPAVIWLTGISGAGKTTVAEATRALLQARGVPTVVLDGDALRAGLCSDLGHSEPDRDENIRRGAHLARLLNQQGFTVVCAFISPRARHRALARRTCAPAPFLEVFVDTPVATAAARDTKGLYQRARDGALTGLPGVDAPYERPTAPELVIQTDQTTPDEAAAAVMRLLRNPL